MMNLIRRITLATLLVTVASSSLITAANAQGGYQNRDRNERRDERRDERRERVEDLLGRIEDGTDTLRRSVDKELDNDSRLNGTDREDEINDFFEEFERDTNNLKNRYRSEQSVQTEVREVLDSARRIDNFIQRYNLDDAQDEWEAMETDLEQLQRIVNAVQRRNSNPVRR
jgi:Skp family chaperone for outer membrane proteins